MPRLLTGTAPTSRTLSEDIAAAHREEMRGEGAGIPPAGPMVQGPDMRMPAQQMPSQAIRDTAAKAGEQVRQMEVQQLGALGGVTSEQILSGQTQDVRPLTGQEGTQQQAAPQQQMPVPEPVTQEVTPKPVTQEVTQIGDREFLLTRNNSPDFGSVTEEVGGNRPIRYESQSREHVLRHLKEIQDAGYGDDIEFVQDVSQKHNAIYQGKDDTLILAKKNGKARVAYIELVPDESNQYYRINSALVSREDFFKNKKPLWERAQTSQAEVVTSNPPSAITGQSGIGTESSIPQTAAHSAEKSKQIDIYNRALEVEDSLQEYDVYNAHMDAYNTTTDYKRLEEWWQSNKDKFTPDEWIEIAEYELGNQKLSPNAALLGLFIQNKISKLQQPVTQEVTEKKITEPTEPVIDRIDDMKRPELVQEAKRLGLPTRGTNSALRDSIRKARGKMPENESKVLSQLTTEGRFVDEIAAATKMSITDTLNALTLLELSGKAKQLPGKRFALKEQPAKERRTFTRPAEHPVQQSLEGLDEGMLFSTQNEERIKNFTKYASSLESVGYFWFG